MRAETASTSGDRSDPQETGYAAILEILAELRMDANIQTLDGDPARALEFDARIRNLQAEASRIAITANT